MMADAEAWAILGIAPTRDTMAIRRSYAAQLKRNNPEDDPDGFVRLRAAYERATQLAAGVAAGSAAVGRPAAPRPEAPAPVAESAPAPPTAAPSPMAAPSPTAAPPPTAALPPTPPMSAANQLMLDMQALDAAVVAQHSIDTLLTRFAYCLRSSALENVGFAVSFESIVARWLLARQPACDHLIAAAAERFGWRERERTLGLDPAVPALLVRLRDTIFWEELQRADGSRRRARDALLQKPRSWRLRLSMLATDLEPAVRTLMEELFRFHPAVSQRFDSGALAWWRRYFSKSRLSVDWLRLLSVAVPVLLLFAFVPRILDHAGSGAAVLGIVALWLGASIAVTAALLTFKLFVIDRLRLWLVRRYRAGMPLWVRVGWFPAAAAGLLLTALLSGIPSLASGIAVLGNIWLVWVALIKHRSLRPSLPLWRRILTSVVFGLPLVIGWLALVSMLGSRRSAALGAAFLALAAVEKIGLSTLLDEYAAALTGASRRMLCGVLVGVALAIIVGDWFFMPTPGWFAFAAAVIGIVCLGAHPLDLFLSVKMQNIRLRIFWFSGYFLLYMRDGWPAPIAAQALALWLLAAPVSTLVTLILKRDSMGGVNR